MSELLVVGAGGMLGRAMVDALRARGDDVRAASRSECDVTDASHVERAIGREVRTVFNCAAWTDVDAAEAHEVEAARLNADAVAVLARRCLEVGAVLVHFGTDYVFDGRPGKSLAVDAPYNPPNAYGRGKAAGDQALARSGCAHLLVRTSWLYAPWGKNFVRTIADLAKRRPTLRVVDDQRGRPTSAGHLAEVVVRLLAMGVRGTTHVTDGGGACSWYELATVVAERVAPSCRVEPCTSAELARPARRPACSILDLARTEALVGTLPDWRINLAPVLQALARD